MRKRKISLILIMVIAIGFLLSYVTSYAQSTNTIFVNLTKADANKIGYGIGNPNQEGGKYIWNLTSYNSNNVDDTSMPQRNLYCIKAEYGKTWEEAKKPGDIIEYNLQYNLQKDREKILNKLSEITVAN